MGESMGTFVFDFIERISVFLIITFPGLTARNAQITNSPTGYLSTNIFKNQCES